MCSSSLLAQDKEYAWNLEVGLKLAKEKLFIIFPSIECVYKRINRKVK